MLPYVCIMNVENAQAQMRKGVLEFCVLAIISDGEVYPLLNRLKNMELLSYQWVESNSGPPRKYYQLTEKGRQFLIELHKTWQELAHAVAINSKNLQNLAQ
jgi:PadR family transcriptional regulator PadR